MAQDGPFGRRRNARQHLFRGCDAGDFRRVDAQQPGSLDEVSDQLLFLFEVGRGDHRDVRDAEQFGKRRHFENSHVAQHALGREETRHPCSGCRACIWSVETSPFIRTSASPATTAATASRTQLTSLFSSTILKIEQSIPSAPADLFDDLFVAVEGRFDQSLLICVVDGAERVGILAVGDGQPVCGPFSGPPRRFARVL